MLTDHRLTNKQINSMLFCDKKIKILTGQIKNFKMRTEK